MLTLLIISLLLSFILNSFLLYKKYKQNLFKIFSIKDLLDAVIFARPFVGVLLFGNAWFTWEQISI